MKYLKVWVSFRDVISPLSDDEKGRLFDMMLSYADSGIEPSEFRGNERFIWPGAKQAIDLTAERNEKLRENGMRGGRPKTKDNQTEPNETKQNQSEPNVTCKEKKRKEKESNEKDIERRLTPPTLQEVEEYCRERGNSVDAQMFVDFYSAKGWKVGSQSMKDWKACVRTWERRERKPVAVLPAQNYSQRDYSGEQDAWADRLMNWAGRKKEG